MFTAKKPLLLLNLWSSQMQQTLSLQQCSIGMWLQILFTFSDELADRVGKHSLQRRIHVQNGSLLVHDQHTARAMFKANCPSFTQLVHAIAPLS